MGIKIKDSFIIETNANRIKSYMLSKALCHEDVSDAEIKKIYGISDKEFGEAIDKLLKDFDLEKT